MSAARRSFPRPTLGTLAKQQGLTLVELMIAIAIALFITLGLSLLYVNMKSSFNAQDQMAQLQDAQRVAATMLNTTVESAGYIPNPSPTNTVQSQLPASTTNNLDGSSFALGQFVVGTGGGTGTGTASDTLNVRNQTSGTDNLMNCQGATNATQTVWVDSFAIDNNNNLTCAVNGGTAYTLVANVSAMKVLYGVDIDQDGSADTYLTASQMTIALYGYVRSVKVTLTFIVPASIANGTATTRTWTQTIRLMNNQ